MENYDNDLLDKAIYDNLIVQYMEPEFPYYYIGCGMLKYLGYSSKEEFIEAIDGKMANGIHPDDLQFATVSISRQIAISPNYHVEYRVRKKDGSYTWVQDYGKCINQKDGRTLLLYTYYDCAQQNEIGMSDESRLYRDIINRSTNGVYVVDQSTHKLLYANSAIENVLAKAGIDNCLGQACYRVLRNRNEPCENCLVCTHNNIGRQTEVYLEFLQKHYAVDFHSVKWRGVPAYVIYLSDISEEKKAANEITQIYNNIPGAVFRCKFDADWTVIFANDGLFEFLGYSREEFSTMGNKLSKVVHPQDVGDILPSIWTQIKQGKAITEHKQRFICKDGTVKWAFIRSQLLENKEDGEFFYCVLIDITEQKKAKFELRNTQKKLTAAIDNAGIAYWEYDIANNRAYLNAISIAEYSLDEVIENYPDSLYESGTICAESVPRYNSMIKAIKNGEPIARADIRTTNAKGEMVWKRVQYTTLFDDQNKPFWAVATAESIDDYKNLENRFSTVLEQNNIDTWLYDLQRHTIIQNHNTENIYGIKGTEIHNVPESLIEKKQCYLEDCDKFREFYKKLYDGEKQVSVTARLWDVRVENYVWKRCTYTILPNRGGEPIYALGSAADVSDQMETKEKYEIAIKDRYRTLGENVILAGHCNVTRNVILEVDDKTGLDVEHRFGLVREDFFRGIASLIPNEEQRQTFCQIFLNKNMKNSFELGITHHDYSCSINLGEEKGVRWVSTHVATALQPTTNELIGFLTVTDVSESKMQEQVLDAVIQFDYDFVAHLSLISNTVVFYSSKNQMAHLRDYSYGVPYSYTDAIQRTAESYITYEDRALYEAQMNIENVTQQLQIKDSYEFIYHLRESNGEVRTKKTRFAIHDRAAGIVVFSRADVTDMLLQQEKQKIALSESLTIARQANSSKSKFLSSMSHDIRTPMNAIVGMCNLAIEDEHNERQVHESLQVIKQSSALLLSMITDILDMNRIESGKTVLTSEVFSFSEQLKIAAGRARALASKKQQKIELSLNITHDRCDGDIVRIHRVIDNILANALKFTPQGGQITYRLTESKSENKNIGLYRFEISDTGIGISPEEQKHIFEPFYRAQKAMTFRVEGTGLGLSIVKSIVDYMGGTISVHSALNQGTTFVIELPLRFAEGTAQEFSTEEEFCGSFDLSGTHVLLCEDHPMNQLVATRILEKSGIAVTVAGNGSIGYEIFAESKQGAYDAILMDVQMPIMNGYETTQAIRECAHPQAKTIPIIAMTANAFAEDVQKSIDAGMNDHLTKPIEPKQLYATLAKFITLSSN